MSEISKSKSFTEHLTFWLFGILIFLPPYFRGLFFAENQRAALLFAAIIFLLTCIHLYMQNRLTFFDNHLDYLVLGLPVVYIISTFMAANYSLAIDEVLENLLYYFVFWVAVRLITSVNDINKIFVVIYISAIGVSLAGLLTASGFLEIQDGFLINDGGTIASTFQYKNTLASFLIAAIFIASTLWVKLNNKYLKCLLTSSSFLLYTVLFSSQSHGGYIIFGIFLVVLWFLYPTELRFKIIVNTICLTLLGFLGSRMFLKGIGEAEIVTAWLWIIAGVVITLLGNLLIDKLTANRRPVIITLKKLLIAAVVVFLIGLIVAGSMGVFQMLAEKIHMHGAMERLTMYEDGLKMVADKPIIGWGGGAWQEAYRVFQGYGYTARQNHSYFLQIAIETGLVGLLVAISIWVTALVTAYKGYKKSIYNSINRTTIATLICSIFAILSHAVFDFDLSLSALTMVLFTLLASLVSMSTDRNTDQQISSKLPSRLRIIIPTVVVVVTLIGTSAAMYTNSLTKSAVTAVQEGNVQKALALTQETMSFNTLNPYNYAMMSQIYTAASKHDIAIKYAEDTVKMAKYDPDRYVELGSVYLKAGQNDKAVATAYKAIEMAPLHVKYYEQLSAILVSATINELKKNNLRNAEDYMSQTLSIPTRIKDKLDAVESEKKELWFGYAPVIEVTNRIKLNLGIANLYSGNIEEATKYINEVAQDPKIQKKAVMWQAVIAQKQGNTEQAEQLIQTAEQNDPNVRKQFDMLSSLND